MDVNVDVNVLILMTGLGLNCRNKGWEKALAVNDGDAMKDNLRRIGSRLLRQPDLNKFIRVIDKELWISVQRIIIIKQHATYDDDASSLFILLSPPRTDRFFQRCRRKTLCLCMRILRIK